MIMTWLISWERVCYSSSNEFLCCSLLRSAEDTSEVQFDPDSFMQTVEDMLGMCTAIYMMPHYELSLINYDIWVHNEGI